MQGVKWRVLIGMVYINIYLSWKCTLAQAKLN